MDGLSIGEVCSLLQVKPHIVRYWEQEIDLLSPKKELSGRRSYSDHDVQILSRVKYLVQERRFTLEGARERIFAELSGTAGERNAERKAVLEQVRHGLLHAARQLGSPGSGVRNSAGDVGFRSLQALERAPEIETGSDSRLADDVRYRPIQVLRPGATSTEDTRWSATVLVSVITAGIPGEVWGLETRLRAAWKTVESNLEIEAGRDAPAWAVFCPAEHAVPVEREAARLAARSGIFPIVFPNIRVALPSEEGNAEIVDAGDAGALLQLRAGAAGQLLIDRGVTDACFLPAAAPGDLSVHEVFGLIALHRTCRTSLTVQVVSRGRPTDVQTPGNARYRVTGVFAVNLEMWRGLTSPIPLRFRQNRKTVENEKNEVRAPGESWFLQLLAAVPESVAVEWPPRGETMGNDEN
ncbi:MAG TPA: MerR family transcriptional regulator [Spirochaetia bacterium]|nr:MerR family transcriptional regulator [Spirochaetia bacterium]